LVTKIALVTDDEETISAHLGRALYYVVVTIEDGKITGRETRDKAGHHTFADEPHDHEHGGGHGSHEPRGRGFGQQAESRHARMIATSGTMDHPINRTKSHLGLPDSS
jgi:predicted Fe-Mo cluster-binding NifX family protein